MAMAASSPANCRISDVGQQQATTTLDLHRVGRDLQGGRMGEGEGKRELELPDADVNGGGRERERERRHLIEATAAAASAAPAHSCCLVGERARGGTLQKG
jgi:hypothetical protein